MGEKIFELRLADFGEGLHEGEILQWYVKPGDRVEKEQPLLEVHTEKLNTEVTSPVSGIMLSIERQEGEIVKVGELLAKIEVDDEDSRLEDTSDISKGAKEVVETSVSTEISSKQEEPEGLFQASFQVTPVNAKTASSLIPRRRGRVLASPAVRRRARETGIDLSLVPGSGPGGRITRKDLETYLASAGSKMAREGPTVKAARQSTMIPSGGEERIPLRGTRRTIAINMRKSKDTAAHYTYFEEVDMTALDDLRQQVKPLAEEKGVKLSYLPLIIKCLVPALKQFPILNSSVDDERQEIIIKHYYNIGIAVDTPDGLIVPVVKNVDQKTIWEIAAEIQDLAARAREGRLRLEDVQGGTFTITSIGNIGGVMATPIIRWPEVAILGVMKRKLRPVVIEKYGKPEIAIRPMIFLSLTLDHRVVDGAVGARFMNVLIKYMENPGLFIFD